MIVIAMEEEKKRFAGDEKVLVTGVGAVNILQALRDVPRDTPIRNIGYAGSNSIPVGTEVRVGRVELYHPHYAYEEPVFQMDGDVPCYTSCDFVTETEITEPCVFDMELAFILALGFTNVTAVKIVSDSLSTEEFEKNIKED